MYDPSTIVDMRHNVNFNQGRSIPTTRSHSARRGSPVNDIHSPPEVLGAPSHYMQQINGSKCITMNQAPPYQQPKTGLSRGLSPQSSVCDGCHQLQARVLELEGRTSSTSDKLLSFENEVLSILKGISADIREMKRNSTPSLDQSPQSRWSPHVLDMEPRSRYRVANENTVPYQGGPARPSALTRDAIAGACVALEKLVSDARVQARGSQR